MKKPVACLLALCALLPLFAACQSQDGSGDTTTVDPYKPTESLDPFDDQVPEFDFNQHTFIIAAPSPDEWGIFNYYRESENSETINDAIFSRNKQIEDRFNIIIDGLSIGQSSMVAPFQQYKYAGEDVIDLLASCYLFDAVANISNEDILPWNDVPYINLKKAWWNENTNKTLSILGQNYYLVGDINWSAMAMTMVCYFNKNVAKTYSSVVGDLYQTVRDGNWTFDTAYDIAKQISNESSGNGAWDANDTYGALQNISSGPTAFIHAANYHTVIMTKDGPLLNYMSTKMNNIFSYIYKFFWVDHVSYTARWDLIATSPTVPIFFDDRALFMFDLLTYAESFRAQESDFGIIPFPKFDTDQKTYTSHQSTWGLSCAMPCTATNPERTGAILEAMCALSMKILRPSYYELTLMGKIKRDDDSEEMLEIIFDNVIFDFGYCFASDLYRFLVGEALIGTRNPQLTSWYRANESAMKDNYQKVYNKVYKNIYGVLPEENS